MPGQSPVVGLCAGGMLESPAFEAWKCSRLKPNGKFRTKELTRFETIVVLGGKIYVQVAIAVFSGGVIRAPLSGCKGIGFMMGKMNAAIRKGTQL